MGQSFHGSGTRLIHLIFCLIGLFTYHKYEKVVLLPAPLNIDGRPIQEANGGVGENLELAEDELDDGILMTYRYEQALVYSRPG